MITIISCTKYASGKFTYTLSNGDVVVSQRGETGMWEGLNPVIAEMMMERKVPIEVGSDVHKKRD